MIFILQPFANVGSLPTRWGNRFLLVFIPSALAALAILGFKPSAFFALSALAFLYLSSRVAMRPRIVSLIFSGACVFLLFLQQEIIQKPWHGFAFLAVYTAVFAITVREVFMQRRMDRQLKQSELHYRMIAEHTSDLIAIFYEDGELFYASPSHLSLLGYHPVEQTHKFSTMIHPDDFSFVRDTFIQIYKTAEGFRQFEFRIRTLDGTYLLLETHATALATDGGRKQIVAVSRDITKRRATENEMQTLAFHDPLTHLPNRRRFRDHVHEMIEQTQASQTLSALVLIDLDRFKTINDSLGHDFGDMVLKHVSERLRNGVKSKDMVARMGGDEFTVLLTEMNSTSDIDLVCKRILDAIASPLSVRTHVLYLTASLGVAWIGKEESDFDTLMKQADIAMYRSKHVGRNIVTTFEATLQDEQTLALEHELREGLSNGEITVYYQPQIDLSSGIIVGVEALVRWLHPSRGLLPPGEFIQLAEECGLIVELGETVLRMACLEMKRWEQQGISYETVWVNLSPRQFQSPDLLSSIQTILRETGLPPTSLGLEITESLAMKNTDQIMNKLHQLRDLGVRIAIDDFGTGYSSLSYLQQFPINVIKVDKSFTKLSSDEQNPRFIVTAILALARELNLRVIAEGMEHIEQIHWMRQEGCDYAQGYVVARPMTPELLSETYLELSDRARELVH
ncbi:putative bifunctional diguanylate cyclase/phosphodiesterase [Ferroacidibacillus organovorans]|uniref:putative bifunctional diguanylate cyclase/phosphodiesterase n=1 Tax=Ferroacidibacillus organovorans TaxID=1765683 RepID=UPI0009A399C9|nr:bifunctional diguanylate cyclase/phosphodiesterase [Ferroacidibacillus organovorans]